MSQLPILPDRANYGEKCNGCGQCCAGQLCRAAEMVLEVHVLPCPFLRMAETGDRTICGLVDIEIKMKMPPFLQTKLGIGVGYSMPDGITVDMGEFLNGTVHKAGGNA